METESLLLTELRLSVWASHFTPCPYETSDSTEETMIQLLSRKDPGARGNGIVGDRRTLNHTNFVARIVITHKDTILCCHFCLVNTILCSTHGNSGI